jgi:ABC-type transport system involved in multi-copper enzyme maturation permease subunit
MNIRVIALNTFGGFLRDRLIILFCALFVCVILLMMAPLLLARAMSAANRSQQPAGLVLSIVTGIMFLASGFGSLLAAWAAADAIASELRSGTILAVMARPVRRWEFLLGKYLGVQLLMAAYIAAMLLLTYLLAWLGGERIHSPWWLLLLYPLVRYAVYSAVAMLLVTALHPIVTIATVMLIAVAASVVAPSSGHSAIPIWIRTPLYILLPSTNLLSETRFLTLTQTLVNPGAWLDHLTALAYGLDYALVCFLLAVWVFHCRGLTRD